ncbi:MAG: RNA methyltransferase [Patulibacter sp.]
MDVTADPASRYAAARRDPTLAVLEGLHALKHALRFGADVLDVVAAEDHRLEELTERLAPELAPRIEALVRTVPTSVFATLCPRPPQTRVVAIARRPQHRPVEVLALPGDGPVILLEDPRTMSNMGACVRVAAAAPSVVGVLTTGESDPWNPAALRGAAGLHFALPVVRATGTEPTDRPLVAIDPDGDELGATAIPPRALIAFGTERYGLSDELLTRADVRLRIPMRPGVSSLNLATSVAAVLFGTGHRGHDTASGRP